MGGALKTMRTKAMTTSAVMKAKAVETKKKVEGSQFMADAKEKASTAAQKTKAATHVVAQKASHQSKIVAQRVQQSLRKKDTDLPDEDGTTQTPGQTSKLQHSSEIGTSSTTSSVQQAPIRLETAVFGIPLDEAIQKSAKIHPNVPDVVTKCVQYLMKKALKSEGIFRVSGSTQSVKDLKESFDRGENVDLNRILDENVVAGLLKLYFRELPEGILAKKSVEIRSLDKSQEESVPGKLRSIVQSLPDSNRAVLDQLMQLLSQVILYTKENKMNVQNIAIVFSPTLGISIEMVCIFIAHYGEIFVQQDLIEF